MEEKQGHLIRISGPQEHGLMSLAGDVMRNGINVEIEEYKDEGLEEQRRLFKISGEPESALMSLAEGIKRSGADVEIRVASTKGSR